MDDQLDVVALEYARELASGPTFALGVAKKMFKLMYQPDLVYCCRNDRMDAGNSSRWGRLISPSYH